MDWNIGENSNVAKKVEKQLKNLPWKTDFNIVLKLLKPTISVKTKVVNEKVKIGKSKFGGLPHLPTGTIWPNLNGFHYFFYP